MTIGITTVAETGGGLGKVYQDNSGGYIEIAVTAAGYTMNHKFHIAPFSVGEGGAYNSVPSGGETNVIETASNLVALIAALYTTSASVQAVAAYQVQAGDVTVTPTPLDLSAAGHAGTGTFGSTLPVFGLLGLSAHGVDFSRWQAHFHATGAGVELSGGRVSVNTLTDTDPIWKLANYLAGQAAGPGLSGVGVGLNTAVVTHAGEPIVLPVYAIGSYSKRIRRRYRL